MSQTKYKSYQEMIDKLQLLKGKTKLKFRQNYSNIYSEMQWKRSNNNFQFEDRFARNRKKKVLMLIMLEAIMLLKFFQTKPYLKNENIDYFDMYYVIILNKLEKEKNETSFKYFNKFILNKWKQAMNKNQNAVTIIMDKKLKRKLKN